MSDSDKNEKKRGNNDLHSQSVEEIKTVTTVENWVTQSNGSGKWEPFQRTTQETTRRVNFE